MSKRAVVGSVLLATALTACSGGHSSTSMPLAGPAAISSTGNAGTASASTTASSGGSQSTSGATDAGSASPQTVTASALSYSSYGIWNQPGANPTSGAFVAGTETPVAAMPKTGSASYAGGAVGMATTGTTSTQLTGSFNATADFGHMTVAGGVNMNQIGAGGTQTPYDSYAFSAGFAANSPHFSGTITAASNPALSGITSGSLYGSQAQEIGGTFALQGGGTNVIGAFGGSTTATQPTALTGSSNIGVDFAANSVSGTMTLTPLSGAGSASTAGTLSLSSGTLPLSGSAAAFSGTISSSGASKPVSGTTSGALVGSAANEVGGVFMVNGSGRAPIGAFGGAKH